MHAPALPSLLGLGIPLLAAGLAASAISGDDVYPDMPPGQPPAVPVEDADAASEAEMKPYTEVIVDSAVTFGMVPIPGGSFRMGSPPDEADRKEHEGPQCEVQISPFWMGACEVTWDEYELYMLQLDKKRRPAKKSKWAPQDAWADAVSRPTPPYSPMDFEMGVEGFPAICMTQFAAKQYTKWLSMKTGRFYRLPTEAEWEYACRAGTTTAYSFGDDPELLDEQAWYFDNADDAYKPVGQRKTNPWGLHDMHGNVAEWVLDALDPGFYATLEGQSAVDPVNWPTAMYPRVVRGGSWDDDPDRLRSAARRGSKKTWKLQDPQIPKSIWFHTEATFVGFRLVRPLGQPPEEERARYWEADLPEIAEIQENQRQGGR